jgi:glucose-6-phosphate 1-dehydrogenase
VRAGKNLQKTCTEIVAELKQAPSVVFKERQPRANNHVRFRLAPQVAIGIGARAKRQGQGMTGDLVELPVVEQPQEGGDGRLGAYERLLGDAMTGDATLFARQDVVEAAWAIVDPVVLRKRLQAQLNAVKAELRRGTLSESPGFAIQG